MTRLVLLMLLAGCPSKDITIFRTISKDNNALQTCDANQRYRSDVVGKDEADARAKLEDSIKTLIKSKQGCGALITNEGAGKKLDGNWNASADFQFCRCP